MTSIKRKIIPSNININIPVTTINGALNTPKLSRSPETDIFERLPQDKKKREIPLKDFLNRIIPNKQIDCSKTENSEKISIPGVSDFRNVKEGTLLPKNQPVVVDKNAILLLAGGVEFNLGSEYIAPFINDMKNGQSFTIGRSGDFRCSDISKLISGIHLEISKQKNQIIIKDVSLNGTQIISDKINNNEFVRNDGNNGNPIDENYLKTSKEVRFYFNKAINSGEYTQSFENYKNVILNAHNIAYRGCSGNEYWYKKNNQLVQMEPFFIRNNDVRQINNYLPQAQEVEKIAKAYGDSFRSDNKNTTTLNLTGISPSGLPVNSLSSHIYPSGIHMDEYFKKMYETSKQTLQLIENKAPQKMILNKIAEHYQYAANARPFLHINNSLFMNEVNTLLKKAGMKAIPHGILDHAAQRLQPKTFKRYFTDYYLNNKLS